MTIEVHHIAKQYFLSSDRNSAYGTLTESLTRWANSWKRRMQNKPIPPKNPFWALQEISFRCEPGDRLALLGRNGAGKSTLLKILSRIIPPSKGSFHVKGRLASLLEVGTGFHPELTGRENIFLNGAILGMTRQELTKRLDQIIDFSGVEKFLDTPVKYYSSGMHARLGFSIAAHLDPDILIVDEVLAVGDLPFQEKCLKKLDEASKDGRTILFVSHNIASLATLCNRGLFLEGGKVLQDGPIERCVEEYLRSCRPPSDLWKGVVGDHQLTIRSLSIKLPQEKGYMYQNERAQLSIACHVHTCTPTLSLSIIIRNSQRYPIAYTPLKTPFSKIGDYQLSVPLQGKYFPAGEYTLSAAYRPDIHHPTLETEPLHLSIYAPSGQATMQEPSAIILPDTWHVDSL